MSLSSARQLKRNPLGGERMYLVIIGLVLVAVLLYGRTAALAVRSAKDRDAVIRSLRELQAAFPTLSMKLDEHPRSICLLRSPASQG